MALPLFQVADDLKFAAPAVEILIEYRTELFIGGLTVGFDYPHRGALGGSLAVYSALSEDRNDTAGVGAQ